MSAYVVSEEHIKELGIYAVKNMIYCGPLRDLLPALETETNKATAATIIAAALYSENIRSVYSKYQNCKTISDLPGAINKPEYILVTEKEYRQARIKNPVHILKMLDCLEYQSCETEDWKNTVAFDIIYRIRKVAISKLPDYDEAPWEYSKELGWG